MKCNNKSCYWNYESSCAHESEEAYLKAMPNTLECPSSIRADFESQLFLLRDECASLLNRRTMRELIEIKKFIENQRNNSR